MTETQEPVGESLPSATPADQVVQAVEVPVLVQYLTAVVPVLLEEDGKPHPSFLHCLQEAAQIDKLRKFASDPQTKAVMIQRASVKGSLSSALSLEPMTHPPSCSLAWLPLPWLSRHE